MSCVGCEPIKVDISNASIAMTAEHHSVANMFLDTESWPEMDQKVERTRISGEASAVQQMWRIDGEQKSHLRFDMSMTMMKVYNE